MALIRSVLGHPLLGRPVMSNYMLPPPPSAAHLGVQDDVYRDRCQSAATFRGYLGAFADLEKWGWGTNRKVWELSQLDIAAFLRDQSSRGKSVALRLFRALVWAEKCFGFNFYTFPPGEIAIRHKF